jgi:CRISPR-associated endonuclease/helicase Cas3
VSFDVFFKTLTTTNKPGFEPRTWQRSLGEESKCVNRVLRIPTGFGKTEGVVLSWLYQRVERNQSSWPRRLILCLPMRVLVEQTYAKIVGWLGRGGLSQRVDCHLLMGGIESTRWAAAPEREAIFVGTQDMLLSRALNRGYAAARGRWPMEFGLLHHDALWVYDEIQLMDVALATSVQLAAFRERDIARSPGLAPCRSWWMSATLQPEWLEQVDFKQQAAGLADNKVRIPKEERTGGLFGVRKRLSLEPATNEPDEVADLVRKRHAPGTLTLVIVNSVRRANEVAADLEARPRQKAKKPAPENPDWPEVRRVHSRFRGHERVQWLRDFLSREPAVPIPAAGRIIVATQVVEAGVDLSATLLVTDLAPWSSLVQRFGRCARYEGERGDVVVVGKVPKEQKLALPYSVEELTAAAGALRTLESAGDVGPATLESFEEHLAPSDRSALYPYQPAHVLRRPDLDDLFDTTADLMGADLDVGRFIRDGDDRDVQVFWRAPETPWPSELPKPRRPELCPVPRRGKEGSLEAWLNDDRAAWVFDYPRKQWRKLRKTDLPPSGAVVLLAAADGGYDPGTGWSPKSKAAVQPVDLSTIVVKPTEERFEAATSAEEDDSLSLSAWQTIAEHGRDVGTEALRIASALALPPTLTSLLELAGRWHDAGKAHEAFQARIAEREGGPWAKAPTTAWTRRGPPGFRHELASTLLMFERLAAVEPRHAALQASAMDPHVDAAGQTDPLVAELQKLSALEFDLVAFLVCAHHGKVRCQWAGSAAELAGPHTMGSTIFGIRTGDEVSGFELVTADHTSVVLPATRLRLDLAEIGASEHFGPSWSERVGRLLVAYGPFQLAYLEALLRAADWRASERLEPA